MGFLKREKIKVKRKVEKPIVVIAVADGGGVRARQISRTLKNLEEDIGKPIHKIIPHVVGASGGMIPFGLISIPNPEKPDEALYTAAEADQLFEDLAEGIFPPSLSKTFRRLAKKQLYKAEPLEKTFKEIAGDIQLKDCLISLMMACINIKDSSPVWLKSIKGKEDESPEQWSTMTLADGLLATTAATTYFTAASVETTPNPEHSCIKQKHNLIDGQFFASNGIHRILPEVKEVMPSDAELVVVHLGTGIVKRHMDADEYNGMYPHDFALKGILMSYAFDVATHDAMTALKKKVNDRVFDFDTVIDADSKDPYEPSAALDDGSKKNMANWARKGDTIRQTREYKDFVDLIKAGKITIEQEVEIEVDSVFDKIRKNAKSITRNLSRQFKNAARLELKPPVNDNKPIPLVQHTCNKDKKCGHSPAGMK